MIPLPITFRSGSFEFEQIAREGEVALYRKTKFYRHSGNGFVTFEVVIVQEIDEHQWPNGDVAPAHEYMPSNELWGLKGWSLQTLERAWEKVRELCRRDEAVQSGV